MNGAEWQMFWYILIGAALAVALLGGAALVVFSALKAARRRGFQKVFGPVDRRTGVFNIVYASLDLKPAYDKQGRQIRWPYTKKAKDEPGGLSEFQLDRAVSSFETRAAGYISSAVGREQGFNPLVMSDAEIQTRYDLSFVSLGGPWSNYKSRQALTNPANRLVTFGVNPQSGEYDRLVAVDSGKVLAQSAAGRDYGLIARIRPAQFPERVWLVCAGLGERGTSGAAWYLANRWRDLLERSRGAEGDFAAIIRVERDSDESGTVFAFFNTPAEVKARPKFKKPARSKPQTGAETKAVDQKPGPAKVEAVAPEKPAQPESEPQAEPETAAAPEPEPVPEAVPAPEWQAEYQNEGPIPTPAQGPAQSAANGPQAEPIDPTAQSFWPNGEFPQRSVMAQLNQADEPRASLPRDESGAGLARRPVEVDPRPVDSHYPLPMIDTPPAQSADYKPRNLRVQGESRDEDGPVRRTKEVSYV